MKFCLPIVRHRINRATLEPLFASYGMPANSDYFPVLDLNAEKAREVAKQSREVL